MNAYYRFYPKEFKLKRIQAEQIEREVIYAENEISPSSAQQATSEVKFKTLLRLQHQPYITYNIYRYASIT